MHNILEKLFKKRKIESFEALDNDEKATFQEWDRILSRGDLSMSDLKQFMEARIGEIEMRWQDKNTPNEAKAELIPYHTVYKTLLRAIDAPRVEREALEQMLIGMTK